VVEADEWDQTFSSRRITRIRELADVSVVSYPASPTTSAALTDAPADLLPEERGMANLEFVAREIGKALDAAQSELRHDAAVQRTQKTLEDDVRELRASGELLRLRLGIDRPKPKQRRTPTEKRRAATLKFYDAATKDRPA
jgi:hypothetical protein